MKPFFGVISEYLFFMLLICIQGYIVFRTAYPRRVERFFANRYLGWLACQIQVPIIALLVLAAFLKINGMSIGDLSIGSAGTVKSLIIGSLFSIPFIIINVWAGVHSFKKRNLPFKPATGEALVAYLIYFVVYIALIEELFFRGYFPRRLAELSMSTEGALLVGALMFALMHLPFYLLQRLGAGSVAAKLGIAGFMHLVMAFQLGLSGNIAGVILSHALIDLSGNILVPTSQGGETGQSTGM